MKTLILIICVLFNFIPFATLSSDEIVEPEDVNDEPSRKRRVEDAMKDKQYQAEIANGDMADLFSTNMHKMVPPQFSNFGRRFVLEYPYYEKSSAVIDAEAEERFDRAIKEAMKNDQQDDEDDNLRPVKAPPDIVLAVARQSAMLQKAKPFKVPDEPLEKSALRNGDYWNAFWKEEVPDPTMHLRSGRTLESVSVKIMPGSKLYKLVSMTKDLSPKLLYVINDNNDDKK